MALFWKHIFMELMRATPYLVVMGAAQYWHSANNKIVVALMGLLALFFTLNWRELLSSGRAVQMISKTASGSEPAAQS